MDFSLVYHETTVATTETPYPPLYHRWRCSQAAAGHSANRLRFALFPFFVLFIGKKYKEKEEHE